jgi:hypothetical protein
MSAEKPDGAWCPAHRKHHGYKSMGLKYGERNAEGKFKLLWFCWETGNVLEEM